MRVKTMYFTTNIKQYQILIIVIIILLELTSSFVPNLLNKNRFSSKSSSLNSIIRNLKQEVEGGEISYDYYESGIGSNPAILYLPCLNRPKNEAKASNLVAWCRRADYSFICADYYGVGRSSGTFEDGTVGRWAKDTIVLIESVVKKKVILVGHGVGAWVSFIIASKRPDLVSGIVGLSADPDFTEELLWKNLDDGVKEKIMSNGLHEITWGNTKYPISWKLIEDGRENLLLGGEADSYPVTCPVRLIHSISDEEVNYSYALKLVENIQSKDAVVTLLKDSNHGMEDDIDMKTMRNCIKDVLSAYKGDFDLTSPGSG